MSRAQVQPIGLDIGFDSIKMLQVEVTGQTLSVVAAARESLPLAARERPELRLPLAMDVIKRMLRHGKFVGRRVIAPLPRDILHVKNLRMPLIPPQELAAAVKFEAKNIFPFDTEQACLQILPAGEVRQGIDVRQEVIVLAARNDEINAYVEQLHRAGLIVESLDIEPAAIYRSQERFIRRREDEQEVNVLVDVGFRRTQVVIGRGRDISFMKPIDLGSLQLHEAISKRLGITMEEARGLRRRLIEAAPGASMSLDAVKRDSVRQAVFDATRSTMEILGREISLCLRYYSVTFRGQRPVKLRLLGGEAADPLLLGVLNASLGVPVEAGQPLFSVDTDRMDSCDRKGFLSEWGAAFGLSLKLTTQTFAPRDGKPRDPVPTTAAEVVDINKAVEAASPEAMSASSTDAATRSNGHGGAGNGTARKEEVHA
jgi:type IV pilus assembly protein PilM